MTLSDSNVTTAPAGSLLDRFKRNPWLSPLNDLDVVDELLAGFDTTFSLSRILARIVEIRDETADTKTFVLNANRHWRGFVAGQHAIVETQVNGRLVRRPFSISSDPADRSLLSFTIKRNERGTLSRHLHSKSRPGNVLRLMGPAAGDFVLPGVRPSRIVMIGAGSGITPFRSMLYTLMAEGYRGQVTLKQICRNPADAIFGKEFADLAKGWDRLDYQSWHTESAGRPSAAQLAEGGALDATAVTLFCGPAPMLKQMQALWAEHGLGDRLRFERFGLPAADDASPGAEVTVSCMSSGISLQVASGQPLLPALEAAGLQPKYGCRIGICRSCRYDLKSGSVTNLLTGQVLAEPDQAIQLCICSPNTPIEIARL